MSRGPGRAQQAILTRVKRCAPGEQFLLEDLGGTWDSMRRAAFALERRGRIRTDGAGRRLVVRPPARNGHNGTLPRPKSDTYQFGKGRDSSTYRRAESKHTGAADKRLPRPLSVESLSLLLNLLDEMLELRLPSQHERHEVLRIRDELVAAVAA